jgi:hypothetical protein
MFHRQTLFILGAGASEEVGLPLGTALAGQIKTKMDVRFGVDNQSIGTGDIDLYGRIIKNGMHDEYQDAAWLIRDGISYAQSIDDFLDLHRANGYVNLYGKAAIVKCILEAERNSKLYFDRWSSEGQFKPEKIANTWFVKFMRRLSADIPKENVREIFNRVAFINFNYDRCVEHFLFHALQKLYDIREADAKSTVDDLNIIHPYGEIHRSVEFGTANVDCVELAAGIKTYTEQIGNADIIARLGAEVARAESIIFLGFAYHRQNMLILKPSKPMPPKHVYGTAFGMSNADVDVVSHQIADFMAGTINSKQRSNLIKLENNLTSAGLFDDYAKSLTGGD